MLSAVIAGRGSMRALDYALTRIEPAHFEVPRQRVLFTLLQRYADQTRGIMSREALEDLLRGRKPGSVAMFCEFYDARAKAAPKRDQFIHSVDQLRLLAAERETGEAFAAGVEILRADPDHPVKDESDGGRELRGHEDARSFVLAEMARIERNLTLAVTPEGDAWLRADDILTTYARAKELRLAGKAPGVLFGLPRLDAYIDGGLAPGEFALILAWTTAGKSRFCVQTAWNASVVQGKNVVLFTTETRYEQVCNNLVARHSRLPRFGLERGLNSRDIRAGRLTREEEHALGSVVQDLKTNTSYARCRVIQLPEHCTISGMAARYAGIRRQFPPHLCIADYLQLFDPDKSSREARMREDQAGVLKSAQRWCGAADVPFISPWQVNKTGRQGMKSNGGYQLEDASETTEAAKTPDVVIGLADREEDISGGRAAPLEAKVMKVRDGPRGMMFPITADYATSYFTDREQLDDDQLSLEVA